ncbi:MAG: PAS domain S-box protein [Methanobacterium sp.]|uniref:PAS domain-containing protein n=1 Tax=Methanobacterium sp. TaxID=2164 RepID=UPI003D655D9A|nr:PAS domain S-box protein [Methanobacterium sp.]
MSTNKEKIYPKKPQNNEEYKNIGIKQFSSHEKDKLIEILKSEHENLILENKKLKNELNTLKNAGGPLLKNLEKYRNIIEYAYSGVLSIDSKGTIHYVNHQMIAMLGYKTKEVINHNLSEFVSEKSRKKLYKHLKRREKGIKEVYELKLTHKNGSDIWVLISANPLLNHKKQYIGSVAIITDINARKGAEKALMNAVVEKEHDIKLILLNMFDAIHKIKERDQAKNLTSPSKWA